MNINKIVSLKASETEKNKEDKKWFKDIAEYLVPSHAATIEDYSEMKRSYEIVNNDLTGFKTELDEFGTMIGEDIPDDKKETLLPYNKLHNKKNVLIGELLKRTDDTKATLLTAKAVKAKNDKLKEAMQASIEEMIEIEELKTQAKMKGAKPKEVEDLEKNERSQKEPEQLLGSDFLTEWEIFANKAIRYCYASQDVKTKKAESFEDVITADRCIVYSGWKYGKPNIEVINPLYFGFHKAPNVRYIQDGDYAWYKQSITVVDAIQEYSSQLTKSEIEQLSGDTYSNSSKDKRHDAIGGNGEYLQDMQHYREYKTLYDEGTYADKRVGTHQQQGINRSWTQESYVWKTHIEFKAFKEIAFLTYTDEYNEEIQEIVPSNFKVPKDHTVEKFTNDFGELTTRKVWEEEGITFFLETLHIPRKYEVTRLGENIYVDCREVPNQPFNPDNPFSSFELSYKGAVFTDRNTRSISLVQRAIPFQFQYFYIKHIQNRELAKYRAYIQSIDIDQIPDQLGLDEDGEPIRDKLRTYIRTLRKTSLDIYSGSQTSQGGLLPSTRSPGSSGYSLGAAVELLNLQNLLEYVDREISITMGISPQREGAFSDSSNVSDNRQAITQSHHITELYFYKLNEIWKAVLNDWLRNFRHYLKTFFEAHPNKTEHFIHYIMPDGVEELLKITPDVLDHTDIGIWLSNNASDVKYSEMMLQLVHAFAQNAGEGMESVSSILKAITQGSSPEETHKMIKEEAQKQAQRAEASAKAREEAQAKLVQLEIDNREDVQKHELDAIILSEREKRITALAKAEIDATRNQKGNDVNENKTPDALEVAKVKGQAALELEKLRHASVENDKDRAIKLAEMKSKEKIAANKPKPKN